MRGAGLPARAGDDCHPSEIALVRVRGARFHERTHLLGRQQLDVRSFEVIDDLRRNPDISDDDVAGMRLTRRQHERQFWRRQRHRHRGVDTVSDELRRIGGQARSAGRSTRSGCRMR